MWKVECESSMVRVKKCLEGESISCFGNTNLTSILVFLTQ